MNRMTAEPVTAAKKNTTIEIEGLDDLRELINEIPEGSIYSVDLSEVISVGQENGQLE